MVNMLAVAPSVLIILISGCTQTVETEDQTVEITAAGFSPNEPRIMPEVYVTFINTDSEQHWPASDVHPTRKEYPGSGIEKCGSKEDIFDACIPLRQGEGFSFTFNEVGGWRYHDHLNAASFGIWAVIAEA